MSRMPDRAALTLLLLLLLTAGAPESQAQHEASRDALDDAYFRDAGIGVVYVPRTPPRPYFLSPDSTYDGQRASTDTLRIREARTQAAAVRARFIATPPSGPPSGRSALEVMTDRSVQGNAIEFDYEEHGLPIDSVTAGGASGLWVRAVYGFTRDGKPLKGWVDAGTSRAAFLLWTERFREGTLYAGSDLAFYDRPGGAQVSIPMEASPSTVTDYSLHPLEMQGRWMRVLVATPGVCATQAEDRRVREAWIEYLDEDRRPQVFYSPRGC